MKGYDELGVYTPPKAQLGMMLAQIFLKVVKRQFISWFILTIILALLLHGVIC